MCENKLKSDVSRLYYEAAMHAGLSLDNVKHGGQTTILQCSADMLFYIRN